MKLTLVKQMEKLERCARPQTYARWVCSHESEPVVLDMVLQLIGAGVLLPIDPALQSRLTQEVEGWRDGPGEWAADTLTKEQGGMRDATDAECILLAAVAHWEFFGQSPPEYRAENGEQTLLETLQLWVEEATEGAVSMQPLDGLPKRLEQCIDLFHRQNDDDPNQPLIDAVSTILR